MRIGFVQASPPPQRDVRRARADLRDLGYTADSPRAARPIPVIDTWLIPGLVVRIVFGLGSVTAAGIASAPLS